MTDRQPLRHWLAALRRRCRDWVRRRPAAYAACRVVKYGFHRGFVADALYRRLIDQIRRDGGRILYLGSGGNPQRDMVNVDITAETGPDIVADGYCLPFADATFDAIICESVIEHVPDPEGFIVAASWTLRPGGYWYFEVPFLQPFHGDTDFQRWSGDGFRQALRRTGLQPVASAVGLGPGFFAMWFAAETLALLFSLGFSPARAVWRWLLRFALSPLLLADLVLLRLPGVDALACSTIHIARRPPSGEPRPDGTGDA